MTNRKFIIRNDDVNPSSNFEHIKKMYSIILNKCPQAEIYSCINIFGQKNSKGTVYLPTKIQIDYRDYFTIDSIFDFTQLPNLQNIASHGLFHMNHRIVTYDTQKFSIISSCNLLKTKIFFPPFWEWNEKTEKICTLNGIKLWVNEDWINIDRAVIDDNHDFYCFHSWKFTPESFARKIKGE